MNLAVLDVCDLERDTLIKKRMDIIKLCDVVCDGKFVEQLADISCKWVGSTNQNVINVQKTLAKGKIVLYNN